MVGMHELVAVLSGGQWLTCELLLFCQEAYGWVCELIPFLAGDHQPLAS